jgi:hypothetical protein
VKLECRYKCHAAPSFNLQTKRLRLRNPSKTEANASAVPLRLELSLPLKRLYRACPSAGTAVPGGRSRGSGHAPAFAPRTTGASLKG